MRNFIFFLVLLQICSLTAVSQENATDSINANTELFTLTLDQLMNLTIESADKKEQKISDIPASIIVVERNEIEAAGYQDLSEILQNVPGLYKIDDKFWLGGTNFGIRGNYTTGTFNDMIILVNGVVQREDYYDSYNIIGINIPVETIDRIEIIKGPMSIMYGSGAFMGVINIITNQQKRNNSIASVSYGTANTVKAALKYAQSIDKFKFTFNAGIYNNKRQGAKLGDMTSAFPNLPSYWGSHTEDETLDENSSNRYFGVSAEYEEFKINLSHTESKQNITDGYPSMNDGSFSSFNKSYVNFCYDKELNKELTIGAKYTYIFSNQLSDNQYFIESSPDVTRTYDFTSQNTKAHDIELLSHWTISKMLNAHFGLYSHITEDIFTTVDVTSQNYFGVLYALPKNENIITNAAYLQIEFKPVEKLLVVGGLRYEKLNNYGQEILDSRNADSTYLISNEYDAGKGNLIPRLAVIYKLNETNVLKAMYGEAIKNPSYGQNNETIKRVWRNQPAVPNLISAKIQTIELNYTSYFNAFALNVSLFSNQLNNLISRDNYRDDQGVEHWFVGNSGSISTNGVELIVSSKPFDKIKTDVSVSYQQSTNKELGSVDLGYSPNVLGSIKVFYNFYNEHLFFISARYIDKMYTKFDEETDGRIGNEEVPSVFIVDANIRFNNLFNTGFYTGLKVNNLLNTEIKYPTTGNSQWADKGTFDYGISIYATLGIKF